MLRRTPINKKSKRSASKLLVDKLDDMMSEVVRKLAMEFSGGCEHCGRRKTSWKELDCSHYVGRANHHTRWDLDNCKGICGGCHRYLDNNPWLHTEYMKKRLGSERLQELMIRSYQTNRVNKDKVKEYLTKLLEAYEH